MVKIKYIGTSHYREILSADFKRHDVEQGKVVWDRDNLRGRSDAKQVNEVTQEAADWLMANEPGDWEIVEDTPPSLEVPPPITRKVRDAPQA